MFNHDLPNYFQKNNKKKRHIFLLACGVLLFLSGCRIIKSAKLQALENAGSVLQLKTGQEVRRSLQDEGTALGKPVYAKIIIEYEPINNHTRKEVYDEIVAILERNNWESESVTVPDYFKATLQQGQFEMLGSVTIDPSRNLIIVIMRIY